MMPAFKIPLRLAVLLLLLIGHASAQDRHIRNYTLRHALAEQVVPVIAAQLSPGSSVTPYYQQLILNVTDAEYHTIQQLLAQLDKAPRSLLISVRKQGQQHDESERYGVQGRIGDGSVQVQTGPNATNGGFQQRTETRAIINRGSAQSSSSGAQQVRAVEGMAAFISAGSAVSMRSGPYGQRELTPVESGFYAVARVVDDQVIVDIDQHDDRLQGSNIATQSLQTQVRGRIGEWIPLGGLSGARADSERGLTNYGNSSGSSLSDLVIKVDLIDQ